MARNNKNGQSTLEYVLLVTAVIVVIIGLVASNKSPFRAAYNSMLQGSVDSMNTIAGKLTNSH